MTDHDLKPDAKSQDLDRNGAAAQLNVLIFVATVELSIALTFALQSV